VSGESLPCVVCPARLEPIFSPRPWGVRSLAPFFPEKSDLREPLGEAWMSGSECVFANGPFAGRKLGDLWPQIPVEWAGTRVERHALFPILVKFIFTSEKLSVQVHPGDAYAARYDAAAGGRGKTEMWYVMEALPDAQVMVGLKPDVTMEMFKQAIRENTAEDCIEHVPVRAGEAIFVPAGTAHTIGPGLVLCEIQEHSDLTYRVYDYNRRDAQGRARPLQVEKALAVMRFGKQLGGKIAPAHTTRGGVSETQFAACRYFATERWEFSERARGETSLERFEMLVFLEGGGRIGWSDKQAGYGPAQAWLLPAALGAYQLEPDSETTLLRTYVPDDLNRLARDWRQRGVAEEATRRLIHR
jgi:mannose-6-phosphate isomerase